MNHFGHFVAEQSTRLLHKTLERPDDVTVMLLPPGVRSDAVPVWMNNVMDWLGVRESQVYWVTDTPLVVGELHAFSQAENLKRGPSEAYLDALDMHAASKVDQLPDRRADFVYVSRAGVAGSKLGGEAYLEHQLRAHGVTVIRPEKLPLHEQLAYYSGARHLIFSEGSAAHCRQLLGRASQRISILVRRKGSNFGEETLAPRCDSFQAVDCLLGNIYFSFDVRRDTPHTNRAFAFVNSSALVEFFAAEGIDLSDSWDETEFSDAQQTDLEQWARRICVINSSAPLPERLKLMEGGLHAIGKPELALRLRRIAKAVESRNQLKR
ncbi:glycosyltransferase 61 family protein [Microbacterium sp. MC2]